MGIILDARRFAKTAAHILSAALLVWLSTACQPSAQTAPRDARLATGQPTFVYVHTRW